MITHCCCCYCCFRFWYIQCSSFFFHFRSYSFSWLRLWTRNTIVFSPPGKRCYLENQHLCDKDILKAIANRRERTKNVAHVRRYTHTLSSPLVDNRYGPTFFPTEGLHIHCFLVVQSLAFFSSIYFVISKMMATHVISSDSVWRKVILYLFPHLQPCITWTVLV